MKIRPATIEDLDVIVDIYNQAVAAGQKTADTKPVTVTGRKQWFADHTPDKYPIFVAEKDNSVIGYLSISAYRPGRLALRYTAEVSYYVDFNHHRTGVASRLMEHAIGSCLSLRIKSLFGILMESNKSSIKLLEKYGFERWAHLPSVADYDGVEVGQVYYGLRVEEGG